MSGHSPEGFNNLWNQICLTAVRFRSRYAVRMPFECRSNVRLCPYIYEVVFEFSVAKHFQIIQIFHLLSVCDSATPTTSCPFESSTATSAGGTPWPTICTQKNQSFAQRKKNLPRPKINNYLSIDFYIYISRPLGIDFLH